MLFSSESIWSVGRRNPQHPPLKITTEALRPVVRRIGVFFPALTPEPLLNSSTGAVPHQGAQRAENPLLCRGLR